VEKQSFPISGALPSSTSLVELSVGQVTERSCAVPDVLSARTQFSTCHPAEDTPFRVVEPAGRQMDSVAARRWKRASDVDTAIKRVSRELQDISEARLAASQHPPTT